MKSWLLAAVCLVAVQAWADTGVMYVFAAKTTLKAGPKMSAQSVANVRRGDKLSVIATKGMWYRVKKGTAEGWISKLFIRKKKPIGRADLLKDSAMTKEKNSRKRSSSYAVSGATRGLTANNRVRGQREEYRSDFQALRDMVSKKSLRKFRKNGGLTGQ